MTNNKKMEFNTSYGDQEILIETGHLAKQADGATFITCQGTQILATVVSAHDQKEDQDFFPLLVDYKEKFYAGGKFLGGFNKREGRPSNAEILLMRMIDRPFRPLFPDGYMFETIIQITVHSYDENADPHILAANAASAALSFSDVPFAGPVGFCKVGLINGNFVLNPAKEMWKKSQIELVVAGTKDAILMLEGEANEVSEEIMVDAIMFAHKHIKEFVAFLDDASKKWNNPKREYAPCGANETLMEKIETDYKKQACEALSIFQKMERQNAVTKLTKQVAEDIKGDPAAFGLTEDDSPKIKAFQGVDGLVYGLMRNDILEKGKRIGDRKFDEVRPISTQIDVLKKVHGSSIFTRGETQVLATVTLGGKEGEQLVDNLPGLYFEKFYLHYTFAPYCVGEARGYRGVGRREIGHGNLAERAIRKVLPKVEDFPYTIRVACEVLESNGSSSMGSICSGTMALMDAGVPLVSKVAGVAMGLIKEGEKFAILTDILGDEDHLGDMDFKVAGSEKGITAIQMDIKISGISKEIFQKALEQARAGRLHILKEMDKTIDAPRPTLKDGVPRIVSVRIPPDKIGALIGPSGRNIKFLQEEYSVSIEVSDDGVVKIVSANTEKIQEVAEIIDLQINGPKIGADYEGIVVSIKEYGAFVDLVPNLSGLLHVSEMTSERVRDVNDFISEGDKIKVRVLNIDRFGKVRLSAKAVDPLKSKKGTKE